MKQGETGFTLIELLVVVATIGLVLGGIYTLFDAHNRMAAKQEETTLMQQELLSVMVMMSDELRMCGYSPTRAAGFGFDHRPGAGNPDYERTTNATRIYCTQDANGNGTLEHNGAGSAAEHVAFTHNSTENTITKFDTGAVDWQPVATNISALQFRYLDIDGNEIVAPAANLNKIRSVQITLTAIPSPERANMPIPARTMTTTVLCRNIAN